MRRVVVTGLGVISPLGNDPGTMFARLMAGESAIRTIAFNGPRGPHANIGAAVDFEPARHFSPHDRLDNLDRVSLFSLAAAAAAVADSGLEITNENRLRCGVSVGTGMGAMHGIEDNAVQLLLRDPDRIRPMTVLTIMNNAPASHVALKYRLGGPNLTYSCACSSSAVSIGEACRQIRHGYADAMVAGGVEAPFTFGFFRAWEAMRVLAVIDRDRPWASCRPFARNRSGLVMGEGAAMVVLEEREAALARSARIYAEVAGYGSSNEYAHITKPTVEGQARAMSLALNDGGVSAEEVGYINAHGTGTALNDAVETAAITRVFGDRAYRVPVSSTKSMHGHLLGGAGALEFVIALLALHHQAIPPTAHLDVPDPECDLDYVPGKGRPGQDIRCVMSNSFAFGGTNAVLIARAMH